MAEKKPPMIHFLTIAAEGIPAPEHDTFVSIEDDASRERRRREDQERLDAVQLQEALNQQVAKQVFHMEDVKITSFCGVKSEGDGGYFIDPDDLWASSISGCLALILKMSKMGFLLRLHQCYDNPPVFTQRPLWQAQFIKRLLDGSLPVFSMGWTSEVRTSIPLAVAEAAVRATSQEPPSIPGWVTAEGLRHEITMRSEQRLQDYLMSCPPSDARQQALLDLLMLTGLRKG